MKLVIVRHGQSVGNQRRIFQGNMDFKLTKKGITQATTIAKFLKTLNFDVAYSSDLLRAKQTAEEILKFHKGTPLELSKEIRECVGGEIEGKLIDDIRHILDEYDEFPYKKLPKGGESNHDVWVRSTNFIEYLKKTHKKKTVLVVSHFGPISCILTYLNDKGIENRHDFSPLKNTSVSIIEFDEGKPKFTKLNCDKHL